MDSELTRLQHAVAEARSHHEDLVQRRDTLRRMHCIASARGMDAKVKRAFDVLVNANEALRIYMTKEDE